MQPHMSPELLRKRPFDGHAIDIWAGKKRICITVTASLHLFFLHFSLTYASASQYYQLELFFYSC